MYKSLQVCRAAAALLVVLYHLGATVALEKYFGIHAFAVPFRFGDAGVEFFFVLSGFIITHVHYADMAKPSRALAYLRKRLVRIYPIYWFVFLAVYFSALLVPSMRETIPSDPWLILRALSLMPLDQDLFGGTGAPVIIVAWSLQYEMAFYFLVLLAILSRSLAVAALIAIVSAMAFGESFPWSFIGSFHVTYFFLGVGVALLCRSKTVLSPPTITAAIGIFLFFAFGIYEVAFPMVSAYEKAFELVGYGFTSCLIIYGLVKLEDGGTRIATGSLPTLIGDASYSIYLIHFPLISVICKLAMAAGLSGTYGALVTYLIAANSCVVAGVLLHLWVERPLLRSFSRRPQPMTRVQTVS